jgi:hypothetical protein
MIPLSSAYCTYIVRLFVLKINFREEDKIKNMTNLDVLWSNGLPVQCIGLSRIGLSGVDVRGLARPAH